MDWTRELKVLFLSKGNASRCANRGRIFAAFVRRTIRSTGTEASNVHPPAVEVMSEAGADISSMRPQKIASLFKETIRYAVVVCDPAREKYPVFPSTPNPLKWCISDPEIVRTRSKKEEFRQIRDQIKLGVQELIATATGLSEHRKNRASRPFTRL